MTMMNRGCIRIFSGSQPASADLAEQGDLLATITQDGLPFQWGTGQGALKFKPGPVNGACQKDGNWQLVVHNSGQAGWWRFVSNSFDDGADETWSPRIDGQVGEGLILPEATLVSGEVEDVASFFFLIPAAS